MAEEKTNELLNKIEKLIVDGNKELLGRFDALAADVGVLKEDVGVLKEDVGTLKNDVGWIKLELKRIDKKHDTNADAQYDLMRDVKDKLEAHMRVPHAVA
ncbi:MAG: hypothetical protein WC632_04010 [Candidatus Margulisiibacteriota bacterium]